MKKIVALLLALVMVFGMVACAQTTSEAENSVTEPKVEAANTNEEEVTPADSEESPAEETAMEETSSGEEDVSRYFASGDHYKDFAADGKYKVAFICAGLASSWFAPKSAAMEQVAAENGIEYLAINGNADENIMLQALETCIAQDYDGIVWCLANQSLVPTFVERCKEAGIAFISTDDGGMDYDGLFPPTVGLDNYALCYFSAAEMAKEAVARGWAEDLSKLKIIVVDQTISDACHRRMNGATQAMKDNIPGLTDDNFIVVDQSGDLTEAISKFSGAVQSCKDSAENFIVYHYANNVWDVCSAVIDENGLSWDNVLMGGLAQDGSVGAAFEESEAKANALYLTGILSYASGVTIMNKYVDLFQNGITLPAFTSYDQWLVTADNYQEFMDAYETAMENVDIG